MSKSFGLAGLRIGWMATKNRDVYEAVNSFKHYTTICNSAPSEYLAQIALTHKERILQRNRDIAFENLQLLNRFFERHRHRFHWVAPKAGVIGFPSLSGIESIDQFCERVLQKSGVLLLPGTAYDDNSRNFRIGYGRIKFPESLSRFDEFLAADSKQK